MDPQLSPEDEQEEPKDEHDSISEDAEGDSDEFEVEDTEEGGAFVDMGEDEEDLEESGFYDNLAFELPESLLDEIALDLSEKIEYDMRSREMHDKMYAEGIKRTGLGGEAPGGADFLGASKAVHPMITKACIEFQGRMIKEIFPATGPVKVQIPGRVTPKRWKKASRKKKFYNWQLRTQMPEFRPELEQVGIQSSLSGAGYLRFTWNHKLRRPTTMSVTSDKIILPFACNSYYTAERITYIDDITEFEYKERVRQGIYVDVDMASPSMAPRKTQVEEAQDKIEGKEDMAYNQDGVRRVFECNTYSEKIEEALGKGAMGDEGSLPYLIGIDESSKKVVSVVRNWEEEDDKLERMHWVVEWPFIPWAGAVRIGFAQMIGSLSGAATGALRALLDSAHVNNIPTAAVLKGAQVGGQSKQLRATETVMIDGGVGADDIRKLAMPVTYNPPSTVLYQLLSFLTDQGSDMVRTAFETMQDQNPNMPVGTTNALIEQTLLVVSTIIGRMHYSMEQSLKVLERINRMYLTDEDILDDAGELLARRSDFQGPLDVIPASDPGTPTEAHRTAKIQTIAQRSEKFPMVYQIRNVEKMILKKMLNLSDEEVDELLVPQPEPEEMNAANENAAASLGRPISAFPEQDHLAHLQTHLDYMQAPVFGMLPIIAPQLIPAMLRHLAEHISLWYVSRVHERMKIAGEDIDITDYMKIKDPSVRRELDRTIAVVSQDIIDDDVKALDKFPAIIQKAMQVMQQYQPQIQDPMAQAMQQKNEIQQQKNMMDDAARREQMQQKQKELGIRVVEGGEKRQEIMVREQLKQRAEDQRLAVQEQNENMRAAEGNASRERINEQDNLTALHIAEAEVESGEKIAVEKGSGINP